MRAWAWLRRERAKQADITAYAGDWHTTDPGGIIRYTPPDTAEAVVSRFLAEREHRLRAMG